MHVCLCVSGRSVCWIKGKSRSSTLLGSPRQQLVSFIHAFFVNEYFFCERPQALNGGLGPAWDRAHTSSCLGGTPSPARNRTWKSIKPFPVESGFCGKDTAFGRIPVSGSCAPGHVTRP